MGTCRCSFVVLSSHPGGPAQAGANSVFSINLVNTIRPALVIPRVSTPPNALALSKTLPVAPPYQRPDLAHTTDFHKIKDLQTSNSSS